MVTDTSYVKAYFKKIGFVPEIASIYLALYRYGEQTISELARNSGVERTKIYRLTEELKSTNLIEIVVQYKHMIYRAAPISNLQITIMQREQDLKVLQNELKNISNILEVKSLESAVSRVQFYKGFEGVKQMFWNETYSKSEVLCILSENMQSKTKATFFERWARKCNDLDIKFRGIVGDNFAKTQQEWQKRNVKEKLKNWQERYVSDDIFAITHSTIIYNDIVAYYSWRDGEIFGIEIYNQDIANAQKAFFEMLWQKLT
ncbi:MAG: helix-turn-helix domain-containing protein [Candidatus Woesebacteria bacterium]|jgi:sugar-specific transcriptional regulator TrmB